MARHLLALSALAVLAHAQQQCYFGPGAESRGPSELVPCMASGQSACCLLGDICLSGSTCWNFDTGNLYQYGCTDITYKDETCPYKCGSNSSEYPAGILNQHPLTLTSLSPVALDGSRVLCRSAWGSQRHLGLPQSRKLWLRVGL